jgi:hypothetical protein
LERDTVNVMAMKDGGKPIAVSSAKWRVIAVVKFNLWLLEEVVSTTKCDTAWREEYIRTMEGNPSPDTCFKAEAFQYTDRL